MFIGTITFTDSWNDFVQERNVVDEDQSMMYAKLVGSIAGLARSGCVIKDVSTADNGVIA